MCPKESEDERQIRKLNELHKRLDRECAHCEAWPLYSIRWWKADDTLDLEKTDADYLSTWHANGDRCPKCGRVCRNFVQQRAYNLEHNILSKDGRAGTSVGYMLVDYQVVSDADAKRLAAQYEHIEMAKPSPAFLERDAARTVDDDDEFHHRLRKLE